LHGIQTVIEQLRTWRRCEFVGYVTQICNRSCNKAVKFQQKQQKQQHLEQQQQQQAHQPMQHKNKFCEFRWQHFVRCTYFICRSQATGSSCLIRNQSARFRHADRLHSEIYFHQHILPHYHTTLIDSSTPATMTQF